MGFEKIAFKFLRRLRREDLLVLILLIVFTLENRCDKHFKLVLLIIFITGLEQGLFG
ncbi:MAG: hypothetical protein K0Q99_1352 [Clostridia bacterium]|jgi:hypothetical protein|nr:hypothetical protein [Clostridia bacterium]